MSGFIVFDSKASIFLFKFMVNSFPTSVENHIKQNEEKCKFWIMLVWFTIVLLVNNLKFSTAFQVNL